MATKPDLLSWVPDDNVAKIVDPGTTKKTNGFLYLERPPFQYINYLFNRISKWLRGLQGRYAQVVVGSTAQVTAFTATHTIAQLSDVTVPASTRVLFLEGTHTLAADLILTSADCTFEMENAAAIIDLANSFKLGLNGARCRGEIRVTNVTNAVDALQATGTDSRVAFIGGDITRMLSNILAKFLVGSDTALASLLPTTGDVKPTFKTVADTGWVMMDDGSIGNASSGGTTRANADTSALFSLLWTNVANAWAPLQDSTGAFVARGASAAADFAANRRLVLPRALGRALAVGGTGKWESVFVVDTGTEVLTLDSNNSIFTGTKVRVSNTGGALPGGLAAATDYFVIRLSATTCQLATTLNNALAGTAINLTSNGTGVHKITATLITRALGEHLGEESHALLQSETPVKSHTHSVTDAGHAHGVNDPGHGHIVTYGSDLAGGGGFGRVDLTGFNKATSVDGTGISIQSASSNVSVNAGADSTTLAHSLMQPTSFINVMVKL